MRRVRASLITAAAMLASLIACGAGDIELGQNGPRGAADAGPGVPGVLGTGGQDGAAPASFCAGTVAAIPLPILGGCTGDVAKKTFRFAVCSCTNINFNGAIVTDAQSSTTGMASATAGSVGVDGTYNGISGGTRIGGSLWTHGDTAFTGHAIAGELQCGGNLVVDGTSRVDADLYVDGSVQGAITSGGTCHIPAGQPRAGVVAAGGVVEGPVSVAPPCDCSTLIDVAAIVAYFKANNDDAAAGLAPDALASVNAEASLTLPCGRYFLTSVSGGAPIKVRVTGRVALAIEGSLIHNATPITFAVDPGAELDLFVGGDVGLSGGASIGDKTRASATRMYVGRTFGYDGRLDLAANLYLPNGAFTTTTSGTEVWGALFARNIGVTGDLTVHYDPSILHVDGCAPPAAACGSCHDCANPSPACKNGVCGACVADSDCCAPLHCRAGACEADLH